MNSAAALLKALHVAQVGEKPPPGWHTCQQLADEAGLSRPQMLKYLQAGMRGGKVARASFKVPGVRLPVPHYCQKS
jgi:hypothetical protein